MRDSMGGIVTLAIIVFFIVLASGYMAFNVNYTKAFRMKNKIISVFEEYDGSCIGECQGKIKEYAKSIGYSVRNLNCENFASDVQSVQTDSFENLFCYQKVNTITTTDGEKKYFYYKIITKVNIDLPVINNLLNLRAFYLSGDTKTFSEEPTVTSGS